MAEELIDGDAMRYVTKPRQAFLQVAKRHPYRKPSFLRRWWLQLTDSDKRLRAAVVAVLDRQVEIEMHHLHVFLVAGGYQFRQRRYDDQMVRIHQVLLDLVAARLVRLDDASGKWIATWCED